MLLDKALVNRNGTGMTLQLDNITVIPFLLTHLSQFGSNGSHVKAKPSGCPAQRDSFDSANLPAFRLLSPGRKTPGFGEGERAFRLSGYIAVATMLSDLSVGEQALSPSMSSPDHDRTSSHNFHSALSRTLRGHQGHRTRENDIQAQSIPSVGARYDATPAPFHPGRCR